MKISDTTITGNTATKLENWGGGGVNASIIPKSSNGNGWVFELSGKVNITGNNAEGVDNNLYFPEETAGTMLPAATAKTKPDAPSGLQGVAPSTWGEVDGKISGTKATMEWSTDGENWTECTDGATTVGGEGDYYVRIKATDISYASDATTVTVPKYLMAIDFPAPTLSYNYDGNEHTLLVPGEGYTVEGDITKTDAGSYTATVKLDEDKYQWSSTVTDNTISWTIAKRMALAKDFTFTAPESLVWDGNPKTAAIDLNAPYTLGGCKTSLVYKQGDTVVEDPTDPGTYQVYLVITGNGNLLATDGLTADSWKFEILRPDNHIYGAWEHNDTQHWHNCNVPGCSEEQRSAHGTDTPRHLRHQGCVYRLPEPVRRVRCPQPHRGQGQRYRLQGSHLRQQGQRGL